MPCSQPLSMWTFPCNAIMIDIQLRPSYTDMLSLRSLKQSIYYLPLEDYCNPVLYRFSSLLSSLSIALATLERDVECNNESWSGPPHRLRGLAQSTIQLFTCSKIYGNRSSHGGHIGALDGQTGDKWSLQILCTPMDITVPQRLQARFD